MFVLFEEDTLGRLGMRLVAAGGTLGPPTRHSGTGEQRPSLEEGLVRDNPDENGGG